MPQVHLLPLDDFSIFLKLVKKKDVNIDNEMLSLKNHVDH